MTKEQKEEDFRRLTYKKEHDIPIDYSLISTIQTMLKELGLDIKIYTHENKSFQEITMEYKK